MLSNGSERGYANLSFSASGTTLASLSMSPDFMLTVWNWKAEAVALRAKAFGQDVFSVRFSIDDERCAGPTIPYYLLAVFTSDFISILGASLLAALATSASGKWRQHSLA